MCLEELLNGKDSVRKGFNRRSIENINSVQSSQLLLEVFAYRIHSEVHCQIVESDFVT